MDCLNCGSQLQDGFLKGDPFCDGACKHEYRSGQDPNLCAQCQERPARKTGRFMGYCSQRCQRLREMQRIWG